MLQWVSIPFITPYWIPLIEWSVIRCYLSRSWPSPKTTKERNMRTIRCGFHIKWCSNKEDTHSWPLGLRTIANTSGKWVSMKGKLIADLVTFSIMASNSKSPSREKEKTKDFKYYPVRLRSFLLESKMRIWKIWNFPQKYPGRWCQSLDINFLLKIAYILNEQWWLIIFKWLYWLFDNLLINCWSYRTFY